MARKAGGRWEGGRGGEEEERDANPMREAFRAVTRPRAQMTPMIADEFASPHENPEISGTLAFRLARRRSPEVNVENNERGEEVLIEHDSSVECLMARAEHRIIIAAHKR